MKNSLKIVLFLYDTAQKHLHKIKWENFSTSGIHYKPKYNLSSSTKQCNEKVLRHHLRQAMNYLK